MAIPDYQTVMLPLLRFLGDGRERVMDEAEEALAEEFGLTAEERRMRIPSGQMTIMR
ncbi:MAG: winged helix-turn-helix domain-containing protein, partial [Candidatus Polarisedimenticolia bacterium]